jgi:hypothetical protein
MTPYDEARKEFHTLLRWHLENGTCPAGNYRKGLPWKSAAFARAIREKFKITCDESAVRHWIEGRHLPGTRLDYIELVLFGAEPAGQHNAWRNDFRQAYAVAASLQRDHSEKQQHSLIPVVVYNPAHGPGRVLSRAEFMFDGVTDYIERIQVPWGLSRIEIVLTSQHDQSADLYRSLYEKYDPDLVKGAVSPQSSGDKFKVSVDNLSGLEIAQWKVTIDSNSDLASPEMRELVTRICRTHNRQIEQIGDEFSMTQQFFEQSPLSGTITMPLFDRAAFLDAIDGSEDVKPYLTRIELEKFADEMEAAMRSSEGFETTIEDFYGQGFPVIILHSYLRVKYPAQAIKYTKYFIGDRRGKNPLPDAELQMLEMLQFYVIMSQETLREHWTEYRIEHLSPEDAEMLEAFFNEHGLAGALHEYGGVLGMFRLIAKDSPEMYMMLLAALNGLRR